MKKSFLGLGILMAFFVLPVLAQAEIFINFDDLSQFPGESYNYTYSAPQGNIYLYGGISNNFNGFTYPDHTTGRGLFFNDDQEGEAYIDFDFGVREFDFWWLAPPGVSMYGEAWGYDENDNDFYSESEEFVGDGLWHYTRADNFPGLVYGIGLWMDGGYEVLDYSGCEDPDNCEPESNWITGAGIDDLRLYLPGDVDSTVTPEPASMALLGIGLLGMARKFRKRV